MVAQVDFYSQLSGLGDVIASKRKEDARKAAFSAINNPDGTVDFGKAILGLTQAGDIEGAARISQLKTAADDRVRQAERDKINDAWRQDQAAREQKNADRQFGLSASNAAFQREQAKEKPTIQKVKDAAGNEILVMVTPSGKSTPINTDGGAEHVANNPFAADGKQTEGQANASLYARRMFQSERILRDPKSVEAATSNVQRVIDKAPVVGSSSYTGLGNYAQGENYQKFDQAQRDFINATLRRESGAVISDAEFDNARKQYFPRPGDSKDVIAQKQRNRTEAIKGIAGAAGPAYRAPFTFDAAGEMRPYGKDAKQVASQPAQAPAARARNAEGKELWLVDGKWVPALGGM